MEFLIGEDAAIRMQDVVAVYIRAATLPAGQNRYFVLAKIRNSDDAISLATCETMDEANEVLKDAVKKIQVGSKEDEE
nr:MAG TPA: hypothetical protein [Caudoviricetes sp.]